MARPPARPAALTGEPLTGRHPWVRTATERLIAVGYGLTYDAVVPGFPPYVRLLEEIATLVGRSAPAGASSSVLDVSCGTGTVAARTAGLGHRVTRPDALRHLLYIPPDHCGRRGGRRAGALRAAAPAGGSEVLEGQASFLAGISRLARTRAASWPRLVFIRPVSSGPAISNRNHSVFVPAQPWASSRYKRVFR